MSVKFPIRSGRDERGSGASRAALLASAAVVLLAAALRFWALDTGLPNQRTRPDELPVVLEMAQPARGDFSLDLSIYPNAYIYASWLWVEAGLRLAPLVGVEPPGGYQKTLLREPELLFLLGRTASAFAGTLAVLLVVWITRRELGLPSALAAGLLAATCVLHVRDSHALKPDAFLSVATIASLAAVLPLARKANAKRAAVAGAFVGLAMACKLPGVLMLVPLYVASVMGSTATGWRRLSPWPAALGALAAFAVFTLTSPEMVFGGKLFGQAQFIVQMAFPSIFGDPSANAAAARSFEGFRPPDGLGLPGYGSRPWWATFAYHATFSLWYGVGAVATLLAPFAIAWGFASRKPLPVLAAVTCVLHYVVVGLSPAQTSRYLTSVMPVFAVLEGGFLFFVASRVSTRHAAPLFAALTLALVAQPLTASVGLYRIAAKTDTRVLATRWLAVHAAKGDRVLFLGDVLMPYGQPMPPRGVRAVDVEATPEALERASVDWVVTHDHALYYSTVRPEELYPLSPYLTLVTEFDPAAAEASHAVFEANDAYYIPVSGFAGVLRPGPHIRIYRFDASAARDGAGATGPPS